MSHSFLSHFAELLCLRGATTTNNKEAARRGDLDAPQPGRGLAGGQGFNDAERAALELAEQGTRIADAAGGVTDEAWANAAKHYDEDQLAALVCLIAFMNTVNRVNVIVRQPAGDYQPGQFG